MKSEQRRKQIAALLSAAEKPLSGAHLAEVCGVSRQSIVQDISVLKVAGYDILSTHDGYVIQAAPYAERVFKMHHTTAQTEDELQTIVDLGGTVVDVFVWHKVYGKVVAKLHIFSRLQVEQFIEGVRSGQSTELMNITGGYHYHTVRADSEKLLDAIAERLHEKGYIAPKK